MATIEEFESLGLKVAKIIEVERVENSDKLVRLKINLGGEERQIIAGIGKSYAIEDLVNTEIIVVSNLESKELMGLQSQGMLLATVDEDNKVVLLKPEKEVLPGSLVS